ncbi:MULTISPECIES: hypothetical protein [Mycobacterium]|uniref:hypothetical protein n=1 Tax=Mycobacterium TaxID=1763 RepID=UPI00111C5C24|nr:MULTISPECIES: hypothetical protein [Mycobacterium]MBZ4631366.1 hypothetical protein [Mycobacterium avium subsp. hominissuis]QWY65416.1 hypothetical protein BJP78_27535 [Mycobacterium avium subsp. hominissuis]
MSGIRWRGLPSLILAAPKGYACEQFAVIDPVKTARRVGQRMGDVNAVAIQDGAHCLINQVLAVDLRASMGYASLVAIDI